MNIEKNRIKKILLINLKYLGDLVVCSPVYRSLKTNYPESEITIVVRKGYKGLFEFDKNIDNVIEFDLSAERKLKNFKKIVSGIKFILDIRSYGFDMVITFHPTDRIAFWSFFSGAKYRIGYNDQTFNYLFNIKIPTIEESKSYLEYYLDTIRSIDVPINDKKTYFENDTQKHSKDNEVFAKEYRKDRLQH